MAIDTTASFDGKKNATGRYPIFLVELSGLGRFYSTRDPGFTGNILSGEGFISVSTPDTNFQLKSNASQPTYVGGLHKIANNGIGRISYALDNANFARTGDSLISLINTDFLNLDLEDELLENTVIRILLGFDGLDRADYVSLFKGVADQSTATFERFDIRLADDTQRNIVPVPAIIGSDFKQRAFTQGNAFNILLGDVEDVPMTQLVGDASSTLGVQLLTTDTELFYFNPTTQFPEAGTVRVQSSGVNYTVTYDGVSIETVGTQIFGKLSLTSSPSSTGPVGSTVSLDGHLRKYVVSFAGQNIRRIRKKTGAAPAAAPTWQNEEIDPNGADHRRLTVVDLPNSTTDGEEMTCHIASEHRGPNLVFNGNFHDNASGWTVTQGAFNRFLPAATFDYVGRIQTLSLQTLQSSVHQDITVEANKIHRLTFTARNNDLSFMALNIGTPSSSTKYYQFADMDGTSEQLFDLTFLPDETTVRLTMIGDNAASGSAQEGYFDQFDLYDATSEYPTTQVAGIIQDHMPQITIHQPSFDESEAFYAETGDRLAGVLNTTEEQQALLGRIAQQFRAKTFLNESGEQVWRVFNQSREPLASIDTSDVVKGTMKIRRSSVKEIFTHYFVYYGRVPNFPTDGNALGGRTSFTGVASATPQSTTHPFVSLDTFCSEARDEFRKEATKEVFADLVPDAKTANSLLEYVVRLGTHRRLICEFETFFGLVDAEIGDFIRITHPLLNRQTTFEVKEKELAPNGTTIKWVMEQVDVFKFGSYTEHWEPGTLRTKAQVIFEHWEPPAPGEAVDTGEEFAGLPNPHVEGWDADNVSADNFNFQTWLDSDTLYDGLIGSQSFFPYMATSGGIPIAWTGIDMETFSPDTRGIQMNPTIESRVHVPVTQSFGDASGLRSKRYAIDNQTNYPIIVRDDLGSERDSIKLRKDFSEFLWIMSGSINSQPNYNGHLVELGGGDQPNQSPAHLINTNKDFSLRIMVKLTDKSEHYPIWTTLSEVSNETQHPFGLWYNATTDRFMWSVGNTVPGVTFAGGSGFNVNANVSSMTQKVEATTFGSPSAGTWYHIFVNWDVSTGTAGIQINGGTLDTAVITPDFTGYVVNAGMIGASAYTIGGYPPHRFTVDGIAGAQRLTLNGAVTCYAYWQRLLSAAEGTSAYGAGTPVRFDTLP